MNQLFMTAVELAQLTGYKAARCQARWLQENRWRFALDHNRKPKVARGHFLQKMGALGNHELNQFNQAPNLEQPNFEALNRH